MIHILFNDETLVLANDCSLAELLAKRGCIENNFAIALNRQFIPRGQYAEKWLQEGDKVEWVTPMQGG